MSDTVSRALAVVLAVGIGGAPFYQPEATRDALVGDTVPPSNAALVVVCLGVAVAWWSTQGRGYLWADPAKLTWDDLTAPRSAALSRRLTLGWAARWAALAYGAAVSGVVLGWDGFLYAAILSAAFGFLALSAARVRSPGVWESALPLLLAALGSYAAFRIPLVVSSGLAFVGGFLLLRRQPLAEAVGRQELVRNFAARMTQRVSVAFLDVWGLLPPARPLALRGIFARRPILLRYLLAGVLARPRALVGAALIAVIAAALHRVFPAVPPVWWTAIGGYLAAIPFAAPVAQLRRTPGLRRWLNHSTLTVKLTAAAVLALVAALWLAAVTALGIDWTTTSLVAVPLAAAAAVRSVTRDPIDFANVGMVDLGGVLVPMGLVVQVARGIDVLVLGAVLLAAGLVPVVAVLCAAALLS
ncbi:DUF6297 family protein [Actinokineospora globicatena]|uniref:DUF6297 family protein n=1 Tax=Actinokineospora globicatena TaxID=103729 RepID=UPI0020A51642|nr:DUF6297 family protein [Actinokineospora globicatena]MCP2306488.1 hypothetical protein [Actinokineospora globicatena]GLW81917.1 hypothetical protein Aglo01_63980 [Actinokineospora globicatena]GLW88711.1 hypothetical protein Aglo02_63500 [Actinokineospora globicatena]